MQMEHWGNLSQSGNGGINEKQYLKSLVLRMRAGPEGTVKHSQILTRGSVMYLEMVGIDFQGQHLQKYYTPTL